MGVMTALAGLALAGSAYQANKQAKAQEAAANAQAQATLEAANTARQTAIESANQAAQQQAAQAALRQQELALTSQAEAIAPTNQAVTVDIGLPDAQSSVTEARRKRQAYNQGGTGGSIRI